MSSVRCNPGSARNRPSERLDMARDSELVTKVLTARDFRTSRLRPAPGDGRRFFAFFCVPDTALNQPGPVSIHAA